jgi:hypothetical protein
VEQKGPLDADLARHTANGEGGARAPSSLADDDALEDLNPPAIALADHYADFHGVPGAEVLNLWVGLVDNQMVGVHFSSVLFRRSWVGSGIFKNDTG